jgi:hypothetical protein
MKTRAFSRRDLMRAAGGGLLVPAFLRHAFAAPGAEAPPKLVLLMQTNGTHQAHFWPGPGYSASPILQPIWKHEALRAKSVVIKGLYNRSGGVGGNEHDHGFVGLYSGYRTVAGPRGGGISIDQLLKQTLRLTAPFPTQNCGVHAADYPPINPNRLSFSYIDKGKPLPCELDVYKLYATYFGEADEAAGANPAAVRAAADRRLRTRRSVLDSVAGDLKTLEARLGPEQRRKVAAHATALREFEGRLTNVAEAWARTAPAVTNACRAAAPAIAGVPAHGEIHAPALTRLMLDFITMAVACNMTNVLTFQFGRGGEHFHYAWLGIGIDAHDDIAHKDNGDPLMAQYTVMINQWYAQQVAYLVKGLDDLPGGSGGSVLDESLVVWGNEMATGPHGMNGIPVVLFGGAAGRLKGLGTLVDKGPQDYHRLGCSLLNIMGHPSPGFGEDTTCGPIDGLGV